MDPAQLNPMNSAALDLEWKVDSFPVAQTVAVDPTRPAAMRLAGPLAQASPMPPQPMRREKILQPF